MNFPEVVFKTILNPDEIEALKARLEYHQQLESRCAEMTNTNLAEYMQSTYNNIERPRSLKGEPVYDSTMYYVLIPEVIKRLKNQVIVKDDL